MKYHHAGGLPLEIDGQRIEPNRDFIADLDPQHEKFLTDIGAIRRVVEPIIEPEPQSFAFEDAPRRRGKES